MRVHPRHNLAGLFQLVPSVQDLVLGVFVRPFVGVCPSTTDREEALFRQSQLSRDRLAVLAKFELHECVVVARFDSILVQVHRQKPLDVALR